MRTSIAIAIAIVVGAVPGAATAQDPRSFVVRLGADTLVLERYTRSATRLSGEYLIRSPRTVHRTYTADLEADGTVRRFELVTNPLPAGTSTRSTITFTGDSAITTAPRGDSTVTTRMAVRRGAVPSVLGVMGMIELLGLRARAGAGAIDTVDLVAPGAGQPSTAIVRAGARDTLLFDVITTVGRVGPWRVRLDSEGRLVSYDGRGTAFQAEAEPVASLDLAAARAAYGTRPLGPLSARDTARVTLGSSEVWVDYGRPSKRGRVVFGAVVPWNTVWRTGANAATQLRTPVDLTIGGASVPAGTYTLWTLPSPAGWKLIVNKQTGQWGTDYHADQDLVRVDMTVETLPRSVEQFTIGLEPAGAGATLRMSWDRTAVSVPVAPKP